MNSSDGRLKVVTTLRVGIAQVNLTVGDLAVNAATVLDGVSAAAARGSQLVVFPEMTLTGYPPEDLVLRHSFRAASRAALARLAGSLADAGLGDVGVVVGYLDESEGPRNAAAFLLDGQIVTTYFKHHLPNYGVFDEARYFIAGADLAVVEFGGARIALTICEDIWQDGGPFSAAAEAGVDLVVNINGSPYERNKDDARLPLVQRRAIEARAAVIYVNQVGGQDELVFDGDSFVVAADGTLLARAAQFEAGLHCLDLNLPELGATTRPGTRPQVDLAIRRVAAPRPPRPVTAPLRDPAGIADPLSDAAEVWGALVTGTADYARKNGFGSVLVGLSGGIDSAVVAAIAADAIGGQHVHGVAMPSAYSSEHSQADAVELARRLGADFQLVAIEPMVRAFVDTLGLTGLAEENVQARVRGATLMGLSNQHGHLVLATGNKSELSVGYSTLYGDTVGGFAPIKDVPKTLVWELARWRNADAARRGETPPIPENSISKPPSAELRPGQLDSDSLPDYEVLDAVLAQYVDGDAGFDDLVALGFDAELVRRVTRLTDAAEWKRRQYPPGPKISLKAFGRDRRLPISNRWRDAGGAAPGR